MNSVVWSNASGGFLMSQVDWSISAPTRFVLPVSWVVAGEVFALPLAWPRLLHTTTQAGGFPSLPDSIPQWYEALGPLTKSL